MNQENNKIIKILGDFSEIGLNTLSKYRERIESLEKENKHLLDLQRSMDKQYSELEHNWNELKNWLEEENEKLNHYKLLYQKVKEKNEKAVAYIEDRYDPEQKALTHTFDKCNVGELLDILEGSNEI